MDNTALFIVAVVVILAVVMVAWWFAQRRRSAQLQEHFGPEYERTVDEIGDRRKAESELASREKRVNELSIRDLSPVERTNFADSWRDIQAHFVDDPVSATGDADRLVVLVMEARGYPMGDFDQRAADISVQHPDLVQNYRGARDIHLRSERGDASTEDLRQAMVHYRSLFAELLGEKEDAAGPVADHRVA
jgi:hypothetical protein